MRTRTWRASAMAAGALCLAATACSGSSSSTNTSATSTSAPAAQGASSARDGDGASATTNKLTIVATDYAFQTSGNPRPGTVDIVLDNQGKSYHMVEMAPAQPGVTADQVKAAATQGEDALMGLLAGDPDTSAISGLPATIAPGQKSETITDVPQAGTYVMLCFVPGPGGQPHVALGMVGTVDFGGDPVEGGQPQTDGTITVTDSSIEMPASVSSGHGWYAVTDQGASPHSLSIAALPNGTTLDQEYQWFGSHFAQNQPFDGAPGDLVTGLNIVKPGETVYLHLDLPAGHYGYVSTEGEPPNDDYSKGLKGEFDVR